MSVSGTVTLPAQPTVGETALIPLGGNGKEAPHSIWAVRVELASDATVVSSSSDHRRSARRGRRVAAGHRPGGQRGEKLRSVLELFRFSGVKQSTDRLSGQVAPVMCHRWLPLFRVGGIESMIYRLSPCLTRGEDGSGREVPFLMLFHFRGYISNDNSRSRYRGLPDSHWSREYRTYPRLRLVPRWNCFELHG